MKVKVEQMVPGATIERGNLCVEVDLTDGHAHRRIDLLQGALRRVIEDLQDIKDRFKEE